MNDFGRRQRRALLATDLVSGFAAPNRHTEMKLGAATHVAIHPDATAVNFDDVLGDGQP
jgi:hypothetical protein